MKKCIIVFDPYVSINILKEYMPPEVCLIGGILPNNNLDIVLKTRLDKSDFSKLLMLSGNLKKDYAIIKVLETEFEVLAHIVGSELFNFQYIEKLIAKLTGFDNVIPSIHRHSKFHMQKALAYADLNFINGIIVTKPTMPGLKHKINGLRYPLIVRPNQDSVASIDVKICSNFEQVVEGCNNIFEKSVNISGKPHKTILIQEFLHGDEFIVDVASYQGRHYVSGMFSCTEEIHGDVSISRCHYTIDNEYLRQKLKRHVLKTLDALGVSAGFSHLEFIYYKNKFYLVEINPRLSGAFGTVNKLSNATNGVNQVKAFFKTIGYKYKKSINYKYGKLIYLQNFGYQYKSIKTSIFMDAPSYYYHKILINTFDNTRNSKPKNEKDIVGFIILVNNDLKEIENDYKMIRKSEENGKIYIGCTNESR